MNESSALSSPHDRLPKIILVGVGHIFDIREKVKNIIYSINPQMVALELDPARFYSLSHREEGHPSDVPMIYQLLARFQSNLAKEYGSEVGSEMIAAAEAAKNIGAKLALIDMDAVTMFAKMRKSMSMREKAFLAVGTIMALFTRKSTVEKELEIYRKDEEKFMREIKEAYPSIAGILIEERNRYMSDRLKEISLQSNLTVAIIGDGHVSGMQKMISEFAEVEIWRLDDLQKQSSGKDNAEMTMSFVVNPEHKI